jgi:hypothetical protein
MLYNIEIAAFSAENTIKQELFYKSMLNSFEQAIVYMMEMVSSMNLRLGLMLFIKTIVQNWKTSKTSTQSSRDLSTYSHNRNFFNSCLYFKLYITE